MESLITAAQDQALNARYHQRNIKKQPNDSKCRMCYKAEYTEHIVVGCTTFAPSEYTNRQSKVAGYIHWTTCEHMVLQVTAQQWKHITERVKSVNGTTIMWDVPVTTDRTILVNRPGVVLHEKAEKTCLLIDVDIPDDSDGNTKETEKLSKLRKPGDRGQQDV